MTADLLLPGGLLLLAALLGLMSLALVRERRRARAALEATRLESAELRARVDALAGQVAAARRQPDEFVITHLGEEELVPDVVPERIDGKLFADIVLRETVVKAASWAHGVRRALAPETRNRIRFEIRREIKRSRRQRRTDLKELRRELASRQRAQGDAA